MMNVAVSELSWSSRPFITQLPLLCEEMFSSLPRSDQRRWAEIYVRGLLTTPGRKSVKNICDHVIGRRADQCLQQFVNQSPWEHEPVRRALAQWVTDVIQPEAWVVTEVVFPKNGASSVGVARQYARTAGRVLNCQLGIAVFLAGAGGSCPVNWRLLLPRGWDTDPVRRRLAHLPDDEHHMPAGQCVLDAIDEMAADWGLEQLPVVGDLSEEPQAEPLLCGLEERGIPYLLRVAANRPAVTVRSGGSEPRAISPADLLSEPARRGILLLNGAHGASGPGGPAGLQVQVRPLPSAPRPGGAAAPQRPRQRYVVAEWPPRRRGSRMTWLTTLEDQHLAGLPATFAAHEQVNADMAVLNDESGLRHFEGRSFRGWHHHVTLVSIAHAFQLLAASPPRLQATAF